MGYDRKKLIEVASAEVGYLEKASNSNLDSKTGNAGRNNWTKYARDLANKGYFNGNKNGYEWCTTFVNWCFDKAFGKTATIALTCQPSSNSLAAGCGYAANYYKKANRFYKYPEVGDQIFFVRSGVICHTGIVEKVNNGKVYTIEGNTSGGSTLVSNGGGVARKSYSTSSSYIYGYGRPNYNDNYVHSDSMEATGVEKCQVEFPVLRQGMSSGYVKTLQLLLNGYNNAGLKVDGQFGSATATALGNYQKSRGIAVDKVCGVKTWSMLVK